METSVDASIGGGPDSDDPADVDAAVSPDAAPACPNGRRVYLNFDGVTLTDAATSDATQNRASWMTNGVTTANVPPYRLGDADRAAQIQTIVDGLRAQLAAYPMEVVTTRPAAGPYMMIVFGGTAQQVGSRFGVGVQELDCGDLQKSDVAWIADAVSPPQRVMNTAMGAIGFGLGLTATTDPLGCMCGWDNACQSNNNVACTLSPMIARDPTADQLCPGLTSQDEVAAFATEFCQ